ncbi:hypothetical protein KA111_01920 [Candidatus Woesebacteria bacterium]|nr:hypothetical protein [Candidatus Woesebacteria bacterium]
MFDPQKTLIITDFDGTLSKRYIDGKPVVFMMQILEEHQDLSPDFSIKISKLREKYYPYEINPSLDENTRDQKIMEWWQACFNVMEEMNLTKEILTKVARDPKLELRDKVSDFLIFAKEKKIPVVINSSAGIASVVIPIMLEDRHLFSENIKIVANDFIFDEAGKFIGVDGPIITAVNKNGHMLIKKGVYRQGDKSQCLLIGDGFGDAKMADGLSFDKLYKVVFAEKNLDEFRSRFDEVLDINADFSRIIELFD